MKNHKRKLRPPPVGQAELRPVDRAFIHSAMFEIGIIPIESSALDMRIALRQMSPEDARTVKRKFRKLWRKYVRSRPSSDRWTSSAAGLGKRTPSRLEKKFRKQIVLDHIWNAYIAPSLDRFENPQNEGAAQPTERKEDV